jgi:hypothetical protein
MHYMRGMAAEPINPMKELVNLSEQKVARISSFRFDQRRPSENDAVRRSIELGLEAARQGKERAA